MELKSWNIVGFKTKTGHVFGLVLPNALVLMAYFWTLDLNIWPFSHLLLYSIDLPAWISNYFPLTSALLSLLFVLVVNNKLTNHFSHFNKW